MNGPYDWIEEGRSAWVVFISSHQGGQYAPRFATIIERCDAETFSGGPYYYLSIKDSRFHLAPMLLPARCIFPTLERASSYARRMNGEGLLRPWVEPTTPPTRSFIRVVIRPTNPSQIMHGTSGS